MQGDSRNQILQYMRRIAVLVTVFNRKDKTLACLKDVYSLSVHDGDKMDVFLVDGGSSDGTPQAIAEFFPGVNVEVCDGLFWAGGMRRAWNMALASGIDYTHFFLINDDTRLYPETLISLFHCEASFPGGVYIGATKDPVTGKCSYGGRRLVRPGHEKSLMCVPNGIIQRVELGNANIMLVSHEAYEKLGILSDLYTHGIADYDYTMAAVKAGISVVLAEDYCGECRDDHGNPWVAQNSSLRERIKYLYSPKGLAYREYMFYVRKFFPKDALIIWVKLWLKTICPFLWDIKSSLHGKD